MLTAPSLPTFAFPSVSPIWLAARSSFAANSYAFFLVITEEFVASIPSFAVAPLVAVSSIVVTELAPAFMVAPFNALIASRSAYFPDNAVPVPSPLSVGSEAYQPASQPSVSLPLVVLAAFCS